MLILEQNIAKFFSFKYSKIVNGINHRLQMSYLVQFGCFVCKNVVATCIVALLVVVVIHKHKSITIRNETPRLP